MNRLMNWLKRWILRPKGIVAVEPFRTPYGKRLKLRAICPPDADKTIEKLACYALAKYLGPHKLIFLYCYQDQRDMAESNCHTRIRIGTPEARTENGLWPGAVATLSDHIEIAINENYDYLRSIYPNP